MYKYEFEWIIAIQSDFCNNAQWKYGQAGGDVN